MNTILTFLIDLLGEVFPITDSRATSGPALVSERRAPWWRRALGAMLFGLLAAMPFLVMRWLGG